MKYSPAFALLATVLICGLCIQPILAASSDEALQSVETAINLNPNNANFWNSKGRILEGLHRLPEALDAFDKALSIDPNNPESWSGKSNILNQMGRPDEALSAAEKALAIESGKADFWNSKGFALLNLGRYQESLDAFSKGLELDVNNQYSHAGKAEALIRRGSGPDSGIQTIQTTTEVNAANATAKGLPDQGENFLIRLKPILPIVLVFIVLLCAAGWVFSSYRRRTKVPVTDASHPGITPSDLFTPKPLTPKQLPQELSDRYTESELIGKGGFARVFKAKRKDGQFVAVKIPISLDESTGKSFIAELQNWTKLDQPNIVRVFDYNIMPMPYFEMELCDSSLAETKKPVESEETAWIIFNICEGLKYTHKRSIIHRDLKPQNILLKNGVPKISDWGLSRVINESKSTTSTSFTPYYAAPEQIGNKAKDERTDIWQLGVILYELVTGVLPFQGESMIEIGMNISIKDPQRPTDINPGAVQIESVILKCLKKDPAERYQSVLELQKALGLIIRRNYAEQLTMSVSTNDFRRSAFYCGDLVMINMLTGDIATAYKYLSDLTTYAEGDVKADAMELSEQIRNRMEYGITEIPEDLIKKAEIIVHKVSLRFRK